jgi:hypothetical protein
MPSSGNKQYSTGMYHKKSKKAGYLTVLQFAIPGNWIPAVLAGMTEKGDKYKDVPSENRKAKTRELIKENNRRLCPG